MAKEEGKMSFPEDSPLKKPRRSDLAWEGHHRPLEGACSPGLACMVTPRTPPTTPSWGWETSTAPLIGGPGPQRGGVPPADSRELHRSV